MTEKTSQGNPGQSDGWAVGEVVDPDAYPSGELLALEEKKRSDTAQWEDSQNRSPMDLENPAQPAGWGVEAPSNEPILGQGADALRTSSTEPEIVARVFADRSAKRIAGAKVLLGTSQEDHQLGEVIAFAGDKMWVEWRDGQNTIEETPNYELIIREDGE